MTRHLILILLAIAIAATAQKKKVAPEPDRNAIIEQRLRAEVDRLALTGGGKLGVTAIHVETGKRFSRFGSDPFPMASTYKVPIAVQLLTRVDSGKLSLDQMVEFTMKDMHIGSGMISDRFNWPNAGKPGVALSVRSLLELMLLISDNSATDKCLELAGGGAMVNACMKRWGVEGVRVDRPTSWLIADWLGIPWPENSETPRKDFEAVEKVTSPDQIAAAAKKFEDDPRDTATPDGMADLLLKIHTRPALTASSQALLLDIMDRCETGQARIKGLLPEGTQVRHKTGTIGAATNDVGIVTLPGDAGHLVIAAFVRSSEKEIPAREHAIAQVARVLHDFFVLNR